MKKTILWSTAILGMLTLTGCAQSNPSSTENNDKKTEQSSKEKVDTEQLMSAAKEDIDNQKFYQAKDNLEKVLEEEKDNTTATSLLAQINHYQESKDKLADKQYDDAKKLADKVKKQTHGSVKMNEYANELIEEINRQQSEEQKEKKKVATQKKATRKASTEAKSGSSYQTMAQSLSEDEKQQLNDSMVTWCKEQASKGGMAISESGFMPPRGYNETSSYAVKTQDGLANIDIGNQQAGHSINVIGYTTFYTPGTAGTSNDRGIGEGVSPNTIIDRYIWCDNGKVYELKANFDGEESDSVLQGWYALLQDDEALERDDDITFKASEDKAAITKYHSLLEEYGGASDTKKQPTSENKTNASVSWSSDQEQALSEFMEDWAQEMGQSYIPGEIDPSHNYVKMGFQTWCPQEEYQEACSLVVPQMDGNELNYTCGKEVQQGQYQVVSCYGPDPATIAEEEADNRHYYVFAIYNGKPIVLNADDSQDVKPTANQSLQQGFEKIVNG